MPSFDEAWDEVPDQSGSTLSAFDEAWNAVAEKPADDRPTWGQSTKFVLKSLGEGAANVLDTAITLNPFKAPELAGTPKYTTLDLFHDIFGRPEDEGVGGPVANIAKEAVKASVFPVGGPIANALAGAGGEIAHQMAPDSAIAPIAGSIAGSLVPGAIGKVGDVLKKGAAGFERASIAPFAKDYVRSQKTQGLNFDVKEGEEVSTRLSQAIKEIGESEGWGILRDPERLALRNERGLRATGKQIGDILRVAENSGVKPSADILLNPEGATQSLINRSAAHKVDLKKAFDEFIGKFTDPVDGWDGTLTGLNRWKSEIAKMGFSGSIQDALPSSVTRKLQRAIQYDLGNVIEDVAIKSGATDATSWAALNRMYSNRSELAPILNRASAGELADTAEKGLRGLIRTSGGTLTTPTVLGSILGGSAIGGPLGFVGGAALGALGTPTGRGLAAKGLGGAGSIAQAVGRGALVAPLAVGAQRDDLSELFHSVLSSEQTDQSASPQGAENASSNPSTLEILQQQGEATNDPRLTNRSSNKQKGKQEKQQEKLQALALSQPGNASTLAQNSVPAPSNNSSRRSLPTPPNSLAQSLFMRSNMDMTPPQSAEIEQDLAPLVEAVIAQESGGDPNALSSAGARGLMQIMPATAADIAAQLGVENYDLNDPATNRQFGTFYLQQLLRQFGGNIPLALTAYHSGPGRVSRLLELTKGNSLGDILDLLGPVGQRYAREVIARLPKSQQAIA